MQEIIEIYGTNVKLPEKPNEEDCINYGFPKKEQKWKRTPLPSFFETVEYDKAGNLLLTPEQEEYAIEEVKRCKNGVWIFIGGRVRYIPKRYYFYLQYYTLEDGTAPDFREADRLYYLFFEHWFLVLWCLGLIRTKKRRQGASSQSCSNILYESIFYKNSNCGLISKTKDDSKDTFTQMITMAYRMLPAFLKPKQVNKEDSVTELVFAHKSSTVKAGTAAGSKDSEGHNSRINYKAPVLNAYDRGRMSYVLGDEFGKLPKEVPAFQLLSIISKTLVKGVKRVGWIDMPSTVNEMTKGGGAEYKKIWDYANQFKKKPTTNRIVRFFQPAYEAYEGFIDEYGDSVIDAPTQEQYEFLVSKWVQKTEDGEVISELSEEDIKLGAKHYVLVKRREGLDPIDLEEEIRMNPCTEDEAFLSASSDCHFNSINIRKQRKRIEENPPVLRKVTFYRRLDQSIGWRDDENGYWSILHFPPTEKENKYQVKDRMRVPSNIADYVMGVDGYANSQGVNGGRKYGSNAAGFIYDRNRMMYIAMYFGRPRAKELMHEQIMMAAEFYGCKVWYEKTADDYLSYFTQRGKLGYLGKYPKSCIDPEKREKADRFYGFPINPFAMTKQLDSLIAYVDSDKMTGETYCDRIYFDKLLEQMLVFEAEKRTEYDAVVAAMITLCCALEPVNKPNKIAAPIVKIYPSVVNS
jgi:hypothetical protein